MKKKLLTILAVVVCAVALIVGSVAGTLAYLRVSVYVTNTFTYGKVAINLTESAVTEFGELIKDAHDNNISVSGNSYKLFPGTTYVKDPVITVDPSTEDMFLFLKVDNGIAGLALSEDEARELEKMTIHDQLLENGWRVYVDKDGGTYRKTFQTTYNSTTLTSTSSVYYYVGKGSTTDDAKIVTKAMGTIPTIATFTLTSNDAVANEETLTAYAQSGQPVKITAYAIQTIGEGIDRDYHKAASKFASEFASAKPTAAVLPDDSTEQQ